MSWKNHVPSRSCDFNLSSHYECDDRLDVYFVKVSVWVKEEIVLTEQGKVGNKPCMRSVNRELKCPYRIDYNKWRDALVETILLEEE